MSQSKPYLHSFINRSGTRAVVHCVTRSRNAPLATVRRADGFWHVESTSGMRLMPLLPHTEIVGKQVHEIHLGVVLKLLRDTVLNALSTPANTTSNAPTA
jgi:hypothetical protein